MNALIVVALSACVWLYACVRSRIAEDATARGAAWTIGLAMIFSAVAFVAINPTLHPDLMSGLRALVEEHAQTALLQKDLLAGDPWLSPGPDRAIAVASLVGVHPMVFVLVAVAATWQSVAGSRRFSAITVICLWWWIGLVMVTLWIPFAWGAMSPR
jgi:phosphotransferase system  glucose/maltose/N-acetylglucosamine-specific IIC component